MQVGVDEGLLPVSVATPQPTNRFLEIPSSIQSLEERGEVGLGQSRREGGQAGGGGGGGGREGGEEGREDAFGPEVDVGLVGVGGGMKCCCCCC